MCKEAAGVLVGTAVAEVDELELMSPTAQAARTCSLEFASMFTLQVYNITSLNVKGKQVNHAVTVNSRLANRAVNRAFLQPALS